MATAERTDSSQKFQRRAKPPKYQLHAPTGQARVYLHGRDVYLGEYGSRESYLRYAQIIADLADHQEPRHIVTPKKKHELVPEGSFRECIWTKACKLAVARRFGGWIVVAVLPTKDQHGHPMLRCRCVCGHTREFGSCRVLLGESISCKCLHGLFVRLAFAKANGMNRPSRTYPCNRDRQIWRNMIARCTNPKEAFYKKYGGRGIAVCDRWLHSFDAFIEDMGPSPGQDFSLDRINPFRGYEPSNCRWATWAEQMRNKRRARWLRYGNTVLPAGEWAAVLGVPASLLMGNLEILHFEDVTKQQGKHTVSHTDTV